MTCCATDAQLVVREHIGSAACEESEPWNSGTLLASSQIIPSTCDNLANCLVSYGTGGYQWHTFEFDELLVIQGRTYTFELASGVGLAGCGSNFSGGHAIYNGTPVDYDMAMEVLICSAGVTLGCTDPTACSGYNPEATHEDDSCQYPDCHGTCGGEAEELGSCGCIGGLTGIRKAQCINDELHGLTANDGEVCELELSGQDVFVEEDGFLLLGEFHLDPTSAHSMVVERLDGPLAGQVIGSSERAAESESCTSSAAQWRSLGFDALPMQGGMKYRIHFTQGQASATCNADYAHGHGLNSDLIPTNLDLAFRLVIRTPEEGEMQWGCMSPEACNYAPDATHDDGSCTGLDCHGDCGGNAEFIENCGCRGGNTGLVVADCYGCTDASACNYDDDALIEDGSCSNDVDCHGDCGGSALFSPECGCVGGNTGLDASACTELCLGTTSLSTYPTQAEDFVNAYETTFSGCGQTFVSDHNAWLTGMRFRNQFPLDAAGVTVELRLNDADDVHEGTLLATTTSGQVIDASGTDHEVLVEWNSPAMLSTGQDYTLVLLGTELVVKRSNGNPYSAGASFDGIDVEADLNDLFIELITCTDLYGCTSPLACNFDDWATQDNGSCAYPAAGLQCDGTPCGADQDGDGICASADLDDTDPSVCFDGDGDGCDDCSSGTYAPEADGPDTDGDGLCDSGDLCSNPEADNFDDPANGPCEGQCDNAPLFHGIQVDVPATDPWSENGTFTFSSDEAGFPFANSLLFEATTLSLTGMNGAPDYVFDLSGTGLANANMTVQPGWYAATLLNSSGCPGVATAVHGSTFGQAPVALPLIMTYSLCCGDCGNSDVDNDMICDSEDECIDREALNYADPANEPCQY